MNQSIHPRAEEQAQDLSPRVVALFSKAKEFWDAADPQTAITETAVRNFLREVEELEALAPSEEQVAGLGHYTTSVTNLRLAARHATQRLLQATWLSPETLGQLKDYLDRNPAYTQVGPYRFSSDWTSKNEASWRGVLAPFAGTPGIQALEIGSFEGRSAVWLLENMLTHPTSRLVCVDLFVDGYSQIFDQNISASGAAARVEKLAGPSGVVLRRLPPEPAFDFIYVDGSHQAFDTLEDAVLSWRLLRPGGVMTFDDYEMAAHQLAAFSSPARPDIGIDAFLNVVADRIEILHKGFQVTVRKKAE
jgi:predicted O-methyltransferase YrrM